jgi:glycosyltransferase involved in cell wall biosynthesis
MPKISVIVPIYNAEKYLERCVKSLIAQTFHDIEILLIDDGSTDASSILCARLKKEDSRIRILHKPNGGLSSARNAGLLAASGAFIGFVDADDTVSPTFFETLLQKIEQYHCDFVFCDLIRIESGKPPTLHRSTAGIMTNAKSNAAYFRSSSCAMISNTARFYPCAFVYTVQRF